MKNSSNKDMQLMHGDEMKKFDVIAATSVIDQSINQCVVERLIRHAKNERSITWNWTKVSYRETFENRTESV